MMPSNAFYLSLVLIGETKLNNVMQIQDYYIVIFLDQKFAFDIASVLGYCSKSGWK